MRLTFGAPGLFGLIWEGGGCVSSLDFNLAFSRSGRKTAGLNMEQNTAEMPVLLNLLAWAEKNKKQLIFGVAGLTLVGCVVAYLSHAQSEKQIAAGKELSQTIFKEMGRPDVAATSEALLKVAAANAGTTAGAQALLLGANSLFHAGKFAESQATFERFRNENSGSVLVPQAIYGAGTALAAQAKWDDAVRCFKEVVDLYSKSAVVTQAKFALANAYETQGKSDLALPLYQEVMRAGMAGSLANEAAQRAEVLSAKLLPALTTATNAPSEVAPAKP